MNKKSQVSIEVILGMTLIFFLFVTFLVLIFSQNSEVNDLQESVNLKQECLRISNQLSSVYKNGPGTILSTKTPYLIRIKNNNVIEVNKIENSTKTFNNIAILVSEAGASTQSFYDAVNPVLKPTWFKVCFDDLNDGGGGTVGCQRSQSSTIDWSLIPNNLVNLFDNIDSFQTIYLEDAHLHPSQTYSGPNTQYTGWKYIDILANWTAKGNVLIAAEHYYCRSVSSGSTNYNSYLCGSAESRNNDKWRFYGNNITQASTPNWVIKIVNESDPYLFKINRTFKFEEHSSVSWLNVSSTKVIARYNETSPYDPAIAFWNYGSGIVHYIGDFQVISQQTAFSNNLSYMVNRSYYLIASPKDDYDEICTFYGESPNYQVTGNFNISNINNTILITQT